MTDYVKNDDSQRFGERRDERWQTGSPPIRRVGERAFDSSQRSWQARRQNKKPRLNGRGFDGRERIWRSDWVPRFGVRASGMSGFRRCGLRAAASVAAGSGAAGSVAAGSGAAASVAAGSGAAASVAAGSGAAASVAAGSGAAASVAAGSGAAGSVAGASVTSGAVVVASLMLMGRISRCLPGQADKCPWSLEMAAGNRLARAETSLSFNIFWDDFKVALALVRIAEARSVAGDRTVKEWRSRSVKRRGLPAFLGPAGSIDFGCSFGRRAATIRAAARRHPRCTFR
jgi:hypothetical protein